MWSDEFGFFFFFNDTATTEIYTLSLHDALPICALARVRGRGIQDPVGIDDSDHGNRRSHLRQQVPDRKSTRLNSSHANISYAVFCLKKKNTPAIDLPRTY